MAQNNELRIFISSTFRDLQEEREHLVKKIFPLNNLLIETTQDEPRAQLHYWLWKIDNREQHHAEALRLYRELLTKAPKHEYRTRMEELERGAGDRKQMKPLTT